MNLHLWDIRNFLKTFERQPTEGFTFQGHADNFSTCVWFGMTDKYEYSSYATWSWTINPCFTTFKLLLNLFTWTGWKFNFLYQRPVDHLCAMSVAAVHRHNWFRIYTLCQIILVIIVIYHSFILYYDFLFMPD